MMPDVRKSPMREGGTEEKLSSTEKKKAIRRLAACAGTILGLWLCLAFLSGCSGTSGDGKKTVKGYSRSEILVVALTEKKRYEEVCTNEIWNVSLGEDGETFEAYLAGSVQNFMEQLKVMSEMAKEKEISLTAQERGNMADAAAAYYGNLTAEDIEYMGISEDEVQTVFEDYALAEKMVEEMTKGLSLEVSDSEAKVIRVYQAETEDRDAAASLVQSAAEGKDFVQSATETGVSVAERKLGRMEEPEEFEKAAFELENGEVSPVLEQDGRFYVLCCISNYDEEETAARKELIFEERKRAAFQDMYDTFCEEIVLSDDSDIYENLDLASGNYGAGADFFEIYETYALR